MVKQIMATHDQGNGMKQAAEERNSLRCKLRFQQQKQVLLYWYFTTFKCPKCLRMGTSPSVWVSILHVEPKTHYYVLVCSCSLPQTSLTALESNSLWVYLLEWVGLQPFVSILLIKVVCLWVAKTFSWVQEGGRIFFRALEAISYHYVAFHDFIAILSIVSFKHVYIVSPATSGRAL